MEMQLRKIQKQAIDAALAEDWDTAIELNSQLITLEPHNTDPLLALGFVNMQKGDLKSAKKYYRQALKLEPMNSIARNNLDRINILDKKGTKTPAKSVKISADAFMHTKGQTRDVTLANIGQAETLAQLSIGEAVELIVKNHKIEVRTDNGEYVGCLPDDISKRLSFFINAKSKYSVIIKAATKNTVEIFIREVRKGAKVQHYISFPDNIQDDMKMIMKKNSSNKKTTVIEDDDDDDEIVEDIERMAKQAAEDEDLKDIHHLTPESDIFEDDIE